MNYVTAAKVADAFEEGYNLGYADAIKKGAAAGWGVRKKGRRGVKNSSKFLKRKDESDRPQG